MSRRAASRVTLELDLAATRQWGEALSIDLANVLEENYRLAQENLELRSNLREARLDALFAAAARGPITRIVGDLA